MVYGYAFVLVTANSFSMPFSMLDRKPEPLSVDAFKPAHAFANRGEHVRAFEECRRLAEQFPESHGSERTCHPHTCLGVPGAGIDRESTPKRVWGWQVLCGPSDARGFRVAPGVARSSPQNGILDFSRLFVLKITGCRRWAGLASVSRPKRVPV